MGAVVVGQVGRDLVLEVGAVPERGGTAVVRERSELLGGKGANQAVALRQLGLPVALVGVVGDDEPGRAVVAQAARDGIATEHVVVRAGARTALFTDVTDGAGDRRVLEHVPSEVLLTRADVDAAAGLLAGADLVLLQLQQPAEALLHAAALSSRALVVLDGAPADLAEDLLGAADVLRADAHEAELLAGRPLRSSEGVLRAAQDLLGRGPSVVALGVHGSGDVVAWTSGSVVLPHADVPVADPTGGGDAFTAALAAALHRGDDPGTAGRAARAAAARSVSAVGGRPRLPAGPGPWTGAEQGQDRPGRRAAGFERPGRAG